MDLENSNEDSYLSGMTEKQKKIYESALEIFAEKGFAGSSTGEIARKAGVAEGLIFKHFKNKKQLFQKIAFMVVEKMLIPLTVKRIEKILDDNYSDIRIFLTLFFHERLDFIKKHQSFLRIIIQDISFDTELQKFAREQFEKIMYPKAKSFIERHQAAGVIKPLDPGIILRMTMSSFFSYAFLRFILFPDNSWEDEKQIKAMIDVLCEGITIR